MSLVFDVHSARLNGRPESMKRILERGADCPWEMVVVSD